jgi:hypothetical protein
LNRHLTFSMELIREDGRLRLKFGFAESDDFDD